MDSCRVLLLLLLSSMRSADSTTSGFLDVVSSCDVQAVKIRLSEEKLNVCCYKMTLKR